MMPEAVAQPLDGGAGHEDRRLERVVHAVADPPGDRRQQALLRGRRARRRRSRARSCRCRRCSCRARARGRPGRRARPAGRRRSRPPARCRRTRVGLAVARARSGAAPGSDVGRHAEQLAQLGVPPRACGCRTAACATRSSSRSRACRSACSTSHESIVPKRRRSASTPPSFTQPLDLRAREVRVEHEPGALAERAARARPPRSSSQRAAVRRSCQTSARWSGSPVSGSHATTVSRWLVMPMPARSAAAHARVGERLRRDTRA